MYSLYVENSTKQLEHACFPPPEEHDPIQIPALCIVLSAISVFSPRIIQGMMGGRGWGMAYGHIKAFDLFPFPHQRKICTEGLQGRHALGRTLDIHKQTYACLNHEILSFWDCQALDQLF